MRKISKGRDWVRWSIDFGAGFFLFALILSAVFDPRIRVLHTLQALIYIAVIVLTRRQSAWGFGAGFFIAAFWNYTNLFVTTFVRNGADQLMLLLHTGRLRRPDLLVALVAAFGHFLMMVACAVGWLRQRPGGRELGEFVLGGVLAVGYFVLIIFATGRQYIPLVRHVFRV